MGRNQGVSKSGRGTAGSGRLVVSVLAALAMACLVLGVVSAGAATPAGSVYAFGNNYAGQLANTTNNGTTNPNPTPTLVGLPGQTGPVTQIAVGHYHSLAVTSTGQLYAFGDNNDGELGNTTNTLTNNPNPTPTLVTLPGQSVRVSAVAAGYAHSLAATSTGQLYGFGSNFDGELGTPLGNGSFAPNPTPILIVLPGQTGPVIQVAAGSYHSLALTSTGQVYGFGYNHFGELGNPNNNGVDNPNPTPTLVVFPGQNGIITQIAAGEFHSLAITSSGQLYAFGENNFGQLGTTTNSGSTNPNPTPTLVTLPGQNGPVTQIAAGASHSLAVTSTGQLYAFGYNNDGQLGTTTNAGTLNPSPTPTLVGLPGQIGPVTQVAGGGDHSAAVTSSGQLYTFGDNAHGELGYTTTTGINPTPALVTLPPGTTIDTIAKGPMAEHTLALVSDLAITPGLLPAGQVALAYTTTLTETGGTAPRVWSATGLPPGVSINATSGVISGTPTGHGTFTVTVTLTDTYGSQATQTFTILIAPAPTAAQIKALLLREITPHGKAAKIAALLKKGGYLLSFRALTAGKALVSWYFVPKGAHLPRAKPKALLVASGKATFSAAGTLTIKIKLTAKGAKLLAHATSLKLIAKGTFTAVGQGPATAVKAFTLKR